MRVFSDHVLFYYLFYGIQGILAKRWLKPVEQGELRTVRDGIDHRRKPTQAPPERGCTGLCHTACL